MKVKINTTEPQSREIDWSKPMVVQYIEDGRLVLTDGTHGGNEFAGMQIGKNEYRTDWLKQLFTPCTTPVTITFENEL